VLLTELEKERQSVKFESRSGTLGVGRNGQLLTMDFPAWRLSPCEAPPSALLEGLGKQPQEVFCVDSGKNYFVVYGSEAEVLDVHPNFVLLEGLHPYGVIVTAPGNNSDCASRYFAPSYGIPEDPVTGSIHSALVPFWAKRLNKKQIHARQVSERGGELFCEDKGDRVNIAGHAVKYLEGKIYV
jgi:predicted PhzF superfamily epimerase YddE/YHI9